MKTFFSFMGVFDHQEHKIMIIKAKSAKKMHRYILMDFIVIFRIFIYYNGSIGVCEVDDNQSAVAREGSKLEEISL